MCRRFGAPKSASGVVRCVVLDISAVGSLSICFCTPSNETGVGGEEERLPTVLYYDLVEISKKKSKGEHDDESD